jgi:hypothetical protein
VAPGRRIAHGGNGAVELNSKPLASQEEKMQVQILPAPPRLIFQGHFRFLKWSRNVGGK